MKSKGINSKLFLITLSTLLIFTLLLVACSSDEKKESKDSKETTEKAWFDLTKDPSDDFEARDPKLAPTPSETVHNIEISMEESIIEVAPGVKQELWTFNKQFPGPQLRGKIGDQFNVKLTNNGKISHSMDFHSSYAAWDTQMKSIGPGETLEYNFKADKAGIYMYHCGTSPALHHIGNGMWGSIVIDPPDLAKVDHEFIINQGELYLGEESKAGDLAKMQNEDFDAVVFNGYFNQYLHRPIRVEPNERIRVWVLDGGPSENSSFHIVGTIFDTVYKEGNYTLKPGPGGSQALDLQPAQGGFVEFTLKDVGLYPIVTHKFSNVGKGALGLFQAGEVKKAEGGAGH